MPSIEVDFSFLTSILVYLIQVDPLELFFLIFKYIGIPVLIITFIWGLNLLYIFKMKSRYDNQQKKILLAIDIPKDNEQTPKAVENILSHLAGAHTPVWWWDTYKSGEFQQSLSLEIVSIEGHIQFLIHLNDKLRDLVEASVFAQYPQARITEVADYTETCPSFFPNEEYDLYGTELIYVKNNAYPIKVYNAFGDSLTQEYKDPIAALLETLSRMSKGEQVWFQIVLTPIHQEWTEIGKKEVDKILGKEAPSKKGIIDSLANVPLDLLKTTGDVVFSTESTTAVPEKKSDGKKMMDLPPNEANILKLITDKCSKIGFETKVRFIYLAKHEVFNKAKSVNGVIGAIKQFNTSDGNSLKPDYKIIGTGGDYFFKSIKNSVLNRRKMDLMLGYKNRVCDLGTPPIIMNIEEIASIWHFPIMSVKTPLVNKIEMKTGEPPANLPGIDEQDSINPVILASIEKSKDVETGTKDDDTIDPFDYDNDYFEKRFGVGQTKTMTDIKPPLPPIPPIPPKNKVENKKDSNLKQKILDNSNPFNNSDCVKNNGEKQNNKEPVAKSSNPPENLPF